MRCQAQILKLLFCSLALTGCSRAPSVQEVIGRYVQIHDGTRDILVVKPDRTYEHIWYVSGNPTKQNSKWDDDGVVQEDYFSYCRRISFSSFEIPGRKGFWPACIEKSVLGKITITTDPDLGTHYEKE